MSTTGNKIPANRPTNPHVLLLNTQDQGKHKVGYARLREFNSIVAKSLKTALVEMKAGGADEYVLDLRGNGGGAFQSALGVAGLFMDEKPITYVVSAFCLRAARRRHARLLEGLILSVLRKEVLFSEVFW